MVDEAQGGGLAAEIEEADLMRFILASDIEVLEYFIAEHGDDHCTDEAKLERAVLAAALQFYNTKVIRLRARLEPTPLPGEQLLPDPLDRPN
jgi:hypothetical protein